MQYSAVSLEQFSGNECERRRCCMKLSVFSITIITSLSLVSETGGSAGWHLRLSKFIRFMNIQQFTKAILHLTIIHWESKSGRLSLFFIACTLGLHVFLNLFVPSRKSSCSCSSFPLSLISTLLIHHTCIILRFMFKKYIPVLFFR